MKKYYILMNGKRSVHTWDETLIDAMVDKLSCLFPGVIFEKEESPCYTNTMEQSTTEIPFIKK